MRRSVAVALSVVVMGGGAMAAAAPANAATTPLRPVAQVDLTRYVGQWYQLAAVPQLYEIQCSRDVKAQYTLNADNTVAVRNTCTTWFGTASTVNGTARPDNAPRNSALTVSFFSFGGKPVYGSTSNYLVFGLDANYRWALVGDPDRRSGFVLSRTPSLPAATVATIKRQITAAGYDLCSFKATPQTGGSVSRAPIC